VKHALLLVAAFGILWLAVSLLVGPFVGALLARAAAEQTSPVRGDNAKFVGGDFDGWRAYVEPGGILPDGYTYIGIDSDDGLRVYTHTPPGYAYSG